MGNRAYRSYTFWQRMNREISHFQFEMTLRGSIFSPSLTASRNKLFKRAVDKLLSYTGGCSMRFILVLEQSE